MPHGRWAHRFGVSPLMRMTASWSWSAWTDRIQVRGAKLRPWAGPPQFVVADPPSARCRGDQTEPDEEKEPAKKWLTEKAPYKFADQVQISPTRLKRLSQSWFSRSRPSDRCAIPLLRPSHAATAPQPRALIGAHGRSLVSPTLGHQGPDDAGHLVGQGHAHQHRRLASQHAGDPGAGRAPWRAAQRRTALAPMISRRRRVRSPIFEVAPSFCLPPVECWSGVSPTQAAKSRPRRKVCAGGARAVRATAVTGPIPGLS